MAASLEEGMGREHGLDSPFERSAFNGFLGARIGRNRNGPIESIVRLDEGIVAPM
jgi:hypothetical protein